MIDIRKIRFAALASALTVVVAGTTAAGADSWTAPASIETLPNSSPDINTPAVDGCASQSPDGLALAFTSNRTGNFDIYVSTRPNTNVGFRTPVRLAAPINGDFDDACPTLAVGNRLYFSSNRANADYDLNVTQRTWRGWSAPTRLGPNVNTLGRLDEAASLFVIAGHEILFFSSRLPDGTDGKIYQSIDGGPKFLVQGGPNAIGSNNRPSVTHDGRTMFFDSVRPGTLGGPDLYVSSRLTTGGAFGPAVHLDTLSSPDFDARPSISWDGHFMVFASSRPGSTSPAPDVWFASR